MLMPSVSAVGGWLYVAGVRESHERKRYGGKKRVAIVAKWREVKSGAIWREAGRTSVDVVG